MSMHVAMEPINLLHSQFLHFEPQALPANLINLIWVVKMFLQNSVMSYSVQIFVLKASPQK